MTDPQSTDPVQPPAYTPPPAAAPQYPVAPPPAAGYAPAPSTEAGKTLGIIAVVVVFFASVVGLILGYVARSQSRKAGVANTPAKVAIILGWIFTVIGIIGGIIALVVVFASLGALSEACGQLGSGVWELDNGTTITCN